MQTAIDNLKQIIKEYYSELLFIQSYYKENNSKYEIAYKTEVGLLNYDRCLSYYYNMIEIANKDLNDMEYIRDCVYLFKDQGSKKALKKYPLVQHKLRSLTSLHRFDFFVDLNKQVPNGALNDTL